MPQPHSDHADPEISAETPPLKRSSLVRRRVIYIAICGMLISLALRWSAIVLVSSSPVTSANYVVIGDPFSGQCCQSAATRLSSGSVEGILLCASQHRRLDLLGVSPTIEVLTREKLIRDGFSAEKVEIFGQPTRHEWDMARQMDEWLESHEGKNLVLACDRFCSRRWSCICDQVISDRRRSRVAIDGVVDPRYDDFNWWRRRIGIKSYLLNSFRLAYLWLHGEDHLPQIDWSPVKYETAVFQ